ncbi:hypothetical protein EJ05DRAFT_437086 [Pseudovirgaria hyperparasitica]|uniref:GOLD domain-containing protein n=1 Tax=Pseudovirgaria hyperparasitica TaxID=470096 RepID=A0A6A6WA15_9PEZI|nr:uncharacterized protein EJ05DRAFT_437086 [Pseudovirgaria hyperparasitica]KAF2759692.1 hypothetical protein EJ05DRAFT_437086 [Pseudovirgaria hyperparasitica]
MARSTIPSSIHTALTLLSIAILVLPSHAIYFYFDGNSPKCFFEELAKDTLVVGHYDALQWDEATRTYNVSPDLKIQITVEETFDNDHRIVNQSGASKGKYTFSAADSGEHRICFIPSGVAAAGWLTGGAMTGNVKFNLDMIIGETSKIEANDKDKMKDIQTKIRDLNTRLQDIRREQVFQREREAEFRDQSESTNSRVVKWTLVQLFILGITCAWQLTHLRAFFIKQKLT